uniref:Uncharacterized protein n=1 Tax=Nomascus leucogenys TaxID=61853 RepID=A0A2I3GIU2_NOMLE
VIKSISFKSSDSIGYYKKLVFALIFNGIIMLCLHKMISITLNIHTYRTLRSGKYLRFIHILYSLISSCKHILKVAFSDMNKQG